MTDTAIYTEKLGYLAEKIHYETAGILAVAEHVDPDVRAQIEISLRNALCECRDKIKHDMRELISDSRITATERYYINESVESRSLIKYYSTDVPHKCHKCGHTQMVSINGSDGHGYKCPNCPGEVFLHRCD